ncbi:MAG TPA: N-acetylmuramoyl-L-alanine amidase [Longimicrobiales bacterium]
MKSAAFLIGVSSAAALTAFGLPEDDGASEVTPVVLVDAAPTVAWLRPDGPVRVALQAGHWKAAEAPDEQAQLRSNGTRGGGKAEWEINLGIARRTAALLEEAGYVVDILPTRIPPGYWADLFIAIHADGSADRSVSGYRAAAPRRDRTGRAAEFAGLLTRTYGVATGLPHYPLITRRMRGYYAFNSRRYHHALHPMTVGVILETGFLTSPRDRRIIVGGQDRAARGIADAVVRFLEPLVAEVQSASAVTTDRPQRDPSTRAVLTDPAERGSEP